METVIKFCFGKIVEIFMHIQEKFKDWRQTVFNAEVTDSPNYPPPLNTMTVCTFRCTDVCRSKSALFILNPFTKVARYQLICCKYAVQWLKVSLWTKHFKRYILLFWNILKLAILGKACRFKTLWNLKRLDEENITLLSNLK